MTRSLWIQWFQDESGFALNDDNTSALPAGVGVTFHSKIEKEKLCLVEHTVAVF